MSPSFLQSLGVIKMQLKVLFALFVYSWIVFPSYSQVDSIDNSSINSINNTGQKIGLWIENDGFVEAYYKDDERDGIFKCYYRKTGKLVVFGEYTTGNRTGTWYYFNEAGQIDIIECEISKNNDLQILRDDGELMTPKYKSFLSFYNPSGIIKEEGVALYDEDIEIDFFKYGAWKYYNQKGNLLKVEDH